MTDVRTQCLVSGSYTGSHMMGVQSLVGVLGATTSLLIMWLEWTDGFCGA